MKYIIQQQKYALKRSITLWEYKLKCALNEDYAMISLSTNSCPCCWYFVERRCQNCPIRIISNNYECINTPYSLVARYLKRVYSSYDVYIRSKMRLMDLPIIKRLNKKHEKDKAKLIESIQLQIMYLCNVYFAMGFK